MNYLQIWFVVIAGLLGIGIPFLFLGLELPNAMHSALMNEAAEYVILDEEDQDFWAIIPGRMQVENTKSYYVFDCINPEEVAARGTKPILKESGPFIYNYTHTLGDRHYWDEGGKKNRVNLTRQFKHKYVGGEPLNKDYRVLTLSGLKRWEGVKNKARFQIAIEGFFELFYYVRNNLLRDMIIQDLITYYSHPENLYDLTNGLGLSRQTREAIAYDEHYGIEHKQNIYEWTVMCDTLDPYIEHEIMTYFGLDIITFEMLRYRFCEIYNDKAGKLNKTICEKMPYCSGYNASFSQWFYMNVIKQPLSYKDVTFKQVHGIFEFPLYQKVFFEKLNPEYKEQFSKVKWPESGLHYLLDTYFEFPDYKTDEASLLLFENMKRLFEAGRLTRSPFKGTPPESPGASELDLSKFEFISKKIKLSKEQTYMLYSYFDFFVNYTVLLHQFGGNIEKERVAHYGAHSLYDIATYIKDYLDVVIYSRALHKRDQSKTCEESVVKHFDVPETHDMLTAIANTLCHNWYFNTNLLDPVGWKYFIEAVSFPYHYYYQRLFTFLNRTVEGFTDKIFEAMLFKSHSPFWTQLDDIKRKVKAHYQTKTGGKACENDFSPFCTKRQILMTQFYQSSISLFPYPESDLIASSTIADWWKIIKRYMDVTIGGPKYERGFGDPTPLPDREIVAPFEFEFLTRYYGRSPISKSDLYKCMNPIGLYDTDVIYNIFLNIRDPSKLGYCHNFATMFFLNSTRYLLRNLEFGPMFNVLQPEQIIFGYLDEYLEQEHALTDYLSGDDCSINPWIGYNPPSWDVTEKTFEHLKWNHTFRTGSDVNTDIRKYKSYFGKSYVTYRKLILDETGDTCPFETKEPFSERTFVSIATDGLQFDQFAGKTEKGDEKWFLDSTTQRPMKIWRNSEYDFKVKDIEVNAYVVDFKADQGCEKGLYIRNGLDMTSFFQLRSVVTKPRYADIDEPGLIRPIITYTYPIEKDTPPQGINTNESYFIIEPYSGITFAYEKKYLVSLAIYYDDLYTKLPEGGRGELIPYYSIYEKMKVSDNFIKIWEDSVNNARNSRKATAIAFTILGMMFVLAAVGMITRAFYFQPDAASEPKPAIADTAKTTKEETSGDLKIEPAKQKLIIEGEDLQKGEGKEGEVQEH